MSAKKVLQVVGEPVGGIRRHIHSIINGISNENVEFFYSYSSINTDKTFREDMLSFGQKLGGVLPLFITKKPGFSDVVNIFKLIFFVRKNSIAVIHGHGAKGGLYARVIKIFCKVQTIYTPHGGVLHDAFSPLANKIYAAIERILLPLTDILVFESNYSKHRFFQKIRTPNCQAIVNYNGVSLKTVKYQGGIPASLSSKQPDSLHLGIFARLHSMKGQNLAIEALAMLPEGFHLHLFGSGEQYSSLTEKVVKLGLIERVFFHGEVNNPEEIMSFLDGVLIPSTFESFSYVAAEALMMGVPVIASNVGGLQEVLSEGCGVLVDELTPSAFADAIVELFSNPDVVSQQIQRGAVKYQKYFDESLMVKNISRVYESIGG